MNAMISKWYKGKVSDIAEFASQRHRISIARFISRSTWNENFLKNSLHLKIIFNMILMLRLVL